MIKKYNLELESGYEADGELDNTESQSGEYYINDDYSMVGIEDLEYDTESDMDSSIEDQLE